MGNELQHHEFSDFSGLEWTDFNARTFDQQTGRFMQIDPVSDNEQISITPYQFALLDPAKVSDPSGKCPWCVWGAIIGFAVDATVQITDAMSEGKGFLDAVKDINKTELLIATGAGAASGGLSTLEETGVLTGTKLLVAETGLSATKSVADQINDNVKENKPALNISVSQMAVDIVSDKVLDHMSSKIPTAIPTKTATQKFIKDATKSTLLGGALEGVTKKSEHKTSMYFVQPIINNHSDATAVVKSPPMLINKPVTPQNYVPKAQ